MTRHFPGRLRLVLIGAAGLLLAAAGSQVGIEAAQAKGGKEPGTAQAQEAEPTRRVVNTGGLRLSLGIPAGDPIGAFQVTLLNAGEQDLMLNLGMMLGNGKTQIPNRIQVVAIDAGGKTFQRQLEQPRIAGRVDDYVLPLPSGSTYSVRLTRGRVWSQDGKNSFQPLPVGEYKAFLRFDGSGPVTNNTGSEGVHLINFWKGKVESPAVSMSVRPD